MATKEGEALMNAVYDVLRDGVHTLPPDDPYRPVLVELLPQFGRALDRPLWEPVPPTREDHI